MKYLTFPFLLLLLPLIGSGCSSEEKETDSLILSSDSEIFFEQGIDFAYFGNPESIVLVRTSMADLADHRYGYTQSGRLVYGVSIFGNSGRCFCDYQYTGKC